MFFKGIKKNKQVNDYLDKIIGCDNLFIKYQCKPNKHKIIIHYE